MRLADAYLKADLSDKAVSVLRDGLSRWPRNLAARVALSRVLMDQGELEAADAELAEVLDREPEHWGALDLLATLRLQGGDRQGEVSALETLLALAPGRRQVERRLAIARRALEERPALPVSPPTDVAPVPDTIATMPLATLRAGALPLPVDRVQTVPSAKAPTRPAAGKAEPSGPLPGVPRSSHPPPAEDPFFNETMVDLLVAQGRIDEARELTVKLASKRPGRPNIEQRLAALSSGAEAGEHPASSKELEDLMQGVLAAAASELDKLTGAIPQPPVGDDV